VLSATNVLGTCAGQPSTADGGLNPSHVPMPMQRLNLVGLLAKRWIDAGYAVLIVDREGDHAGLAARPGVHVLDAGTHLPSPADLLALARPSKASLVLDLSGLSTDEKLDYLRRLPAAISAERARYGAVRWCHDGSHEEILPRRPKPRDSPRPNPACAW
jgi:hypothetical protein